MEPFNGPNVLGPSNPVPSLTSPQYPLSLKRASLGTVFLQTFCAVDDKFVSKVRMTFNTLEDATKFYKDYSKVADFSTRVQCTNKKGNEIKNQLITCTREEK
ncbi:hypothetical protein Ahy_A09g044387 [Arachis hypogaea]|uniref:FAR1 domain-containing protein n=1 Tax=Arachis hypogaea TaxID=3818 RepID=A0A445BK05_ARAHY|nr:hypothetical protein Ahy_A09g044387 [Arachis hypogaea]